ncbi:Respiratory-chain NADH dehydrogenase domain, 51 kDa subunit [Laribacter hongkongensis HLHK9]|uniref:Respiratory-chain NADH dehydrogenase domain, 51 kDa subunit n=1 Tax=Laribacter hongkongensis (strain HLHK9) TaxID=557598 RepID=C1DAV0_LARHH|nr:NAD(P)H-dependent oxidoreductase subunit E [Laribacter hongkongensis]ACO73281.1 Respiratory-chain NADH dehydrogenase domain, 51 kDa subunit [Laribacter hongkongensis HLHK9]
MADDDLLATLDALIGANQDRRGALLPLLHAIQAQFGYIPDAAVPRLAQALRQSRADIDGVISFYRDFRRTPPRAHTLRLCRAESCQAMGADTLAHLLDHAPGCRRPGGLRAGVLPRCLCLFTGTGAGRPATCPRYARQVAGTAGPAGAAAMTAQVHVACDSVACAVGADALAETLIQEAGRRGMPLEVVRTSCRGLYWLEPLVEVDTAQGRVAYGPVPAGDVAGLFDAGFLDGGAHPGADRRPGAASFPRPPATAGICPRRADPAAVAIGLSGHRRLRRPATLAVDRG